MELTSAKVCLLHKMKGKSNNENGMGGKYFRQKNGGKHQKAFKNSWAHEQKYTVLSSTMRTILAKKTSLVQRGNEAY